MKEPEFWGEDYADDLTHTAINDAIEEALTGYDSLDEMPEVITMKGYVREDIDPHVINALIETVCETALARLDDEYGNPNEWTEPSKTVKKAAKTFIDILIAEYIVWSGREVDEKEINTRAWIKEYRPEWLEEENAKKMGS